MTISFDGSAIVTSMLVCILMLFASDDYNLQAQDSLQTGVRLPSKRSIEIDPITIAISNFGNFSKGDPWFLSMNSKGECILTIDCAERVVKRFEVSSKQIQEVRDAIAKEKLFELNEKYGTEFFDGGSQTLAITIGSATKSIAIFTMSPDEDKLKRRECARALRVHQIVRGWFNEERAMDYRGINRKTLQLDRE